MNLVGKLIDLLWLSWLHDVRTSSLETQNVGQGLTLMVHDWFAIFIKSQRFAHVNRMTCTTIGLAQKVTLRSQVVELLKIKDW